MKVWKVSIVSIGVLSVVAILTRSWWIPHDPRDSSELVRDAQARFRSVAMRPVVELDASSFREHIAKNATLPKAMPSGSGSIEALLNEFSRFYALRFITQDYEQYADWRRKAGYRLREYSDMNSTWQIEKDYAAIFKGPAPADRDVERMFEKFFSVGLTVENGSAKPVAIADSSEGLAVVVGVVTSPSQPRPSVAGVMPGEVWQGKTSGTTRNWWSAPTSARDVLKRDRRVVWAEIGIVTAFGDGAVHPRVHSLYWDPSRGMWILDSINDCNFARAGTAMEY